MPRRQRLAEQDGDKRWLQVSFHGLRRTCAPSLASRDADALIVCAALDHPATLLTVDCFTTEKIRSMRAFGADVEVLETPDGQIHPGLIDDWQERLDSVVEKTGAYWTDQLHNTDALDGYATLGEEILADAPGVTDVVMGVGTAGCAMGTARALWAERDVRVTVLEPAESPYLSAGEGGDHTVEGLAVESSRPCSTTTCTMMCGPFRRLRAARWRAGSHPRRVFSVAPVRG